MRVVYYCKKTIKALTPPLFFLGLTAYFGWNTLNGEHGFHSYKIQQNVLIEAQNAQKDAQLEQQAWARRVEGLKNNVDKDLLDERTRVMLSFAQSDEIIIPYKANDHLY
ncbi:hypothetical protein COMNV_00148 [Commensalibacter sp. Nvir]|uniref:FtsB family cell division protein n=1 Tax=Commensalibacter sp. Nvir TaxID=3069817 RepID=UPI002D5EC5CA|nr:hypothetical protein COMNV_00148 [Commensalibacter sp. Nvir]